MLVTVALYSGHICLRRFQEETLDLALLYRLRPIEVGQHPLVADSKPPVRISQLLLKGTVLLWLYF